MATHVITSTGFEADIDESVLDNMELMEAVYAINDKDLKPFINLAKLMLGEDDKKRLYDHIRENGRVPIRKFSAELTEIMNSLGSKKK